MPYLPELEGGCAHYDHIGQAILVNCKSTHLEDVYKQLNDESILSKQHNGNWILNASLIITNGATLRIDTSDTSWLKINSDGIHAYGIVVFGSLIIDSVKVTSWNFTSNNVAMINEDKSPRPFIRIERNATGVANITNSEIGYLGYNEPQSKGINYYNGNGSTLRGNNIHHLYFGVYFYKLKDLLIENNNLHHNLHYGIDPHTSSSNLIIRNNSVHHNGGQGIICSLDCHHILIEKNEVYDNTKAGIMFSRNMQNSTARANYIHDEDVGIFVSASDNNKIYNNTVSDSRVGIYLKADSSYNTIYENTIVDPGLTGMNINMVSNNTLYSNTIINAPPDRSIIIDDSNKEANLIKNNKIL